MKYKEVFILCDLSTNMKKLKDDVHDIIKTVVWRIEDLSYLNWNVYVNLLVFDGGVFSGRRNILTKHHLIKNYELPMLNINSQNVGSGSIDGMFRAALDMSVSQYKQWILKGVEATPALFIYVSDGSFDYLDGGSSKKGLDAFFMKELQSRVTLNNIDIRVLAFNSYEFEVKTKKLNDVAGKPEYIVPVSPFEIIDENLFFDIFD